MTEGYNDFGLIDVTLVIAFLHLLRGFPDGFNLAGYKMNFVIVI